MLSKGQSEGNRENTVAKQKYTPVVRARGVLSKVYLFFLD
jgi:hypothetical protein